MTPEDHNRTLGILHLIYGGFMTLMMLAVTVFYGFIIALLTSSRELPPDFPVGFLVAFMGLFVGIYLLFGVASLVAGYGMLKRKSWARLMSIISAVVASMNVPFGTALCVYTLWFVFGEGRQVYEPAAFRPAPRGALDPPATDFDEAWYAQEARRRQQDVAYAPPPDWRGQ